MNRNLVTYIEGINEIALEDLYYIADGTSIEYLENKIKVLNKFIIKLHEHHNSFDKVFPIKDVSDLSDYKLLNKNYYLIKDRYDSNINYGMLILKEDEEVNDLNIIRISGLYIDEKYRKKGIGSTAIKLISDIIFKNTNYDGISLKVYEGNDAIKFYEKIGMKPYYRFMYQKFDKE